MKHLKQKIILISIPIIYLFIFITMRAEYKDNLLAVHDSAYSLIVLTFTVLADTLITILILLFSSHLWTNIITGIAFAATITLYNIFHAKLGLFCSPSGLIFSMIASYIAAYLVKYMLRRSNRRLLNTIMGAYFSRNTRQKILSNLVACEPIKKQIVFLECAITDIDIISKESEPKVLFSKLNHILDTFISSIMSNGGRVDKFVGTKIHAYWENPEDVALAVKSAIEGFQILDKTKFDHRLKINIGIHLDDATIGILGTSKIMNYSVVTPALEIVDEIVKTARLYNKRILLSKIAYKQCWREISAIKAATLNLRGDIISTELFEPLELKLKHRLTNIFEIKLND